MTNKKSEWYEEVDWEGKVTEKHAQYVLTEAKGALQASLDSCESLDKKSFFFIAGTISYISILLPIIFQSENFAFIVPSVILFIGVLVALVVLVHAIKPQEYFTVNTSPEKSLSREALKKDYKNFLHCHIASTQMWIEENEKANQKKGTLINWALLALGVTGFVALICHLIIRYYF